MKFAIVAGYYKFGSTGKSVDKNYTRIKNLGHDVKVFYGKKKQNIDDDNVIYFGNRVLSYIALKIGTLTGLSDVMSNLQTSRLIGYLKKYNPDVVWLSGVHGYYINWYRLIKYLKRKDIQTIYTMTDEFAFMGKCCSSFECDKYKTECNNCPHLRNYPESRFIDNSRFVFNLKKKVYKDWDKVVFRSAPYIVSKAKESKLLKNKFFFAGDSSVDITKIYHPRDIRDFKVENNIPLDKKVALLCAQSNDPHKGAQYFEECARKCVDDDIIFIQIAFNGDEEHLPPNFIPVPFVDNSETMAMYYSLADVYVCTSVSDAQPHTCLEALGCGTPIIGFDVSGVPYVASEAFGLFVEPFDVEKLAEAIRNIPRKNDARIKACHEYAKQRYSIEANDDIYADFISDICLKVETDRVNKLC